MIFNKEDKFLLVKILKSNLGEFDVYNKEQVLNLFKDVFLKVKDKYNLSGFFDIDIYVNDNYGMIMEINNIHFYKNIIDVKIKFHLDAVFLMEIDTDEILDYEDVYYYKDRFYGCFKDYSDKEVIYKDIDVIINEGIKIL